MDPADVGGGVTLDYVYKGRMNCEPTWAPNGRCGAEGKPAPQHFWGFEERDDCTKYYKIQDRIWPRSSFVLICSGALVQIVMSFAMMYYCGRHLEM